MQGRTSKQSIFRSRNTPAFSAMRFDENPFTCYCVKEKKRASGFEILHLYLSFSSDIVAVKGLMKDDVRFISYRDCRLYTTAQRQSNTWI